MSKKIQIYDLYPYQKTAKSEMSDAFYSGHKRIIFCSPTGSGKTVTFADIARDSVKNGYRVMIVVDRKELLEQSKEKLESYGLMPSLITAGKTSRMGSMCYIATVQTLVRRARPKVDIIIIDEAHKQIFDKVMDLPEYEHTLFLGATATPKRTGRMNQLSKYYSKMVETISIQELIQMGFLVPAVTFGAKMDRSKIATKGQDYDTNSMFDVFNKVSLYSGVVDKYQKFAAGTKAICFNINVEHSKKVTQSFINRGIKAVHLDGSMQKNVRENILKQFSVGAIQVLCNVDVLTTGYDEWTIETVILNRATKSLPLFLQMAGRGSRITPHKLKGVPGVLKKEHFNLIDMGGNVFSLGFWEQERKWSLTHKTKSTVDPAPVKECPEDKEDYPPLNENGQPSRVPKTGCGALLHASAPSCKYCGYIFDKKKKKLVEAEFVQLENYELLPPELANKSWSLLNFEELETVKKIRGYGFGWLVNQIMISSTLTLKDYAVWKGYKNPYAWVYKMNQIYKK